MQLSDAISARITELLEERDWSNYKISGQSAVPNSTVSNILLCKCKGCNICTLLNIARGFGISLPELFASELFAPENLDDDN